MKLFYSWNRNFIAFHGMSVPFLSLIWIALNSPPFAHHPSLKHAPSHKILRTCEWKDARLWAAARLTQQLAVKRRTGRMNREGEREKWPNDQLWQWAMQQMKGSSETCGMSKARITVTLDCHCGSLTAWKMKDVRFFAWYFCFHLCVPSMQFGLLINDQFRSRVLMEIVGQ